MGKIIAFVGMCGVGKTEATQHLIEKGYKKVYFGDVTFEKLKEENMEVTPENEKIMREKIRENLGMGAYAILNLPKIKELSKDNDVVVESMYSWDEYKILKENFDLILIGIVCDKSLRYERISKRNVRPFNNEEAKSRDIAEIENSAKAGPIAYADYFILNNGSMDDLMNKIDDILETL